MNSMTNNRTRHSPRPRLFFKTRDSHCAIFEICQIPRDSFLCQPRGPIFGRPGGRSLRSQQLAAYHNTAYYPISGHIEGVPIASSAISAHSREIRGRSFETDFPENQCSRCGRLHRARTGLKRMRPSLRARSKGIERYRRTTCLWL